MGTASILLITAYTLAQQSSRLTANDAPMEAAQTAKKQLERGSQPTDVIPTNEIDLKKDIGVFVTVTDNSEHVLASSSTLDGQAKLPPAGTFVYTKQHGSDKFTWQPQDGVRLATYMLPYGQAPNDGFVIAGQSLKLAESRIATYGWLCLAGWLAVLAWATFILLLPYADKKQS